MQPQSHHKAGCKFFGLWVRLHTVPMNSQVWSFRQAVLLLGFLPGARTGGTEQAVSMGACVRILFLPPERGCPQPQHVREGLLLGIFGPHRAARATAAGDSRAPATSRRVKAAGVPRCARSLAHPCL